MRPHPWNDPQYVIAVADALQYSLYGHHPILARRDPSIPTAEVFHTLTMRARAGEADDVEIQSLYEHVARIRRVGSEALTAPAAAFDRVSYGLRFPRSWHDLPDPAKTPLAEVEVLHFGDMPDDHPAWLDRPRVATFTSLQILILFNSPIATMNLDIDLGALPELRVLRLNECWTTWLPEQVLDATRLEWLDLQDNNLLRLPDMSALRALRYLNLTRSGLPPEAVGEVREQLPDCLVVTGSR